MSEISNDTKAIINALQMLQKEIIEIKDSLSTLNENYYLTNNLEKRYDNSKIPLEHPEIHCTVNSDAIRRYREEKRKNYGWLLNHDNTERSKKKIYYN
jgi:hypothetical protein